MDHSKCVSVNTDAANKKQATFSEHDTFVQPLFVPEILHWHQERSKMSLPSDLFFPNTDGKMLNPQTVYRHVRSTLKRSGINIDRQGGRTLRNTFAVSQIQAGQNPETVSKMLGLHDERSIELYKSIAKSSN